MDRGVFKVIAAVITVVTGGITFYLGDRVVGAGLVSAGIGLLL